MEELNQNIFNIKKPQSYLCTVWRYHVSHSVLLIRIDKGELDDEIFYLYFEMVEYFEGPFKWPGANFRLGESDECIKLLHKRGYRNLPEDYLLNQFSLFEVELPNSETVKILAARSASKAKDIPAGFFNEPKQLSD